MALKLAVRHPRDAVVGVFYLVAGLAFAIGALVFYDLGSGSQMGPGYFPLLLGGVLALLGAVVLGRALRPGIAGESLKAWDWRSLFWMVGAVALFGVTLRPLGLVLSVGLLVVLSSLASHEFRWRGALLNAAVLALLTVWLFVSALALPFPVWPAFLSA